MKFGRTYTLLVQIDEPTAVKNTLTISYPTTLDFVVRKANLASTNSATLRVYNLDQNTRNMIQHDSVDYDRYRQIVLKAGYQSEPNIPTIFIGNIQEAFSYREGVNWITEITAHSGMFSILNGQASVTLQNGFNLDQALRSLIKTMPKASVKAISPNLPEIQSQRGTVVAGYTWDEMRKLLPEDALMFIDDEEVYILMANEYVVDSQPFVTVDSDTALLDSPRKHDARIDIPVLFDPTIKMGRVINLVSKENVYNGKLVVTGLSHQGTISGAVAGQARTMITAQRSGDRLGLPYRAVFVK